MIRPHSASPLLRGTSPFALWGILPLPVALASLLVLSGCGTTSDAELYGPGAYIITGRMHWLEIEGGCWQFTSDKGEKYELAGEKVQNLLRNGLMARLVVRDVPDAATICMVGKIVEVIEILHMEE